ncbi:MAG: magnesium transporter [Epsilonproteobacteria bacterium]|nr:MAG: magnesium transporter [Campylobacterota bacterium]
MKHYNEMRHNFEHHLDASKEHNLHATEIAYLLKKLREQDRERFFDTLRKISQDELGDVLLELPEKVKDEAIAFLSSEELAQAIESLESDDATDLIQDIGDVDEDKGEEVVSHLDEDDREEIDKLRSYEEDQAGAWMQTELFDVAIDETVQTAIDRLRMLKNSGELENIHQAFILDEQKRLIANISLEDMIIFDFSKTFKDLLGVLETDLRIAEATMDVQDVALMFEQYDLNVIPVLDWQGKMVGRITSDDIYDVIEERATEQIYNLAGVNDDAENEERIWGVFQKRGLWLFLNLVTAILASLVIAIFDETLAAFIPLAILMPIVASMGGNAGTQTLTVMVRQMALGEIDKENAKSALKKEIIVSLMNGLLFALLMGVVAYLWFDLPKLGIVIGLAMIINMFVAGLFGAAIPMMLKRIDVDPAVGSTVLLTTATDVLGFFSFLGLASIILL